jgi:thioesterase domain-containing protein
LLAYRPAPFDGRITVFHTDATAAVAAAWGARAAAVEMEPLEGDHYSIVRSPRVATLANHLQRLLVPSRDAAATSADADRGLVPVGSAS